jgi:phosphoribosylformimino-5-aminoimidazole carboxamide ribotide isomerase
MTRQARFNVYPAIDLRGGKCVRLKQGDFSRSKEYDADPIERAREWERQGAEVIHVVDLDGAEKGRPVQLDLIERMVRSVNVPLQVGGGIRTLNDLQAARESGAQRVVIGTAAVGDKELRLAAVEKVGASLVVAVDAREGIVATHGWRQSSGIPVLDLAAELAADAKFIPTVASGGVRGVEDVATLSSTPGVVGVVVGTALYEGRVTLVQLMAAIS